MVFMLNCQIQNSAKTRIIGSHYRSNLRNLHRYRSVRFPTRMHPLSDPGQTRNDLEKFHFWSKNHDFHDFPRISSLLRGGAGSTPRTLYGQPIVRMVGQGHTGRLELLQTLQRGRSHHTYRNGWSGGRHVGSICQRASDVS